MLRVPRTSAHLAKYFECHPQVQGCCFQIPMCSPPSLPDSSLRAPGIPASKDPGLLAQPPAPVGPGPYLPWEAVEGVCPRQGWGWNTKMG